MFSFELVQWKFIFTSNFLIYVHSEIINFMIKNSNGAYFKILCENNLFYVDM